MNRSLLLLTLFALQSLLVASAADKRVLLIAGKQSHPPGSHEFRAGCLLLQKCLAGVPGIKVEVYTDGWPSSDSVFEGADAVVIYADGGGGHPAIQGDRIQLMDELAKKGVGIGCMHFAVEVPKGKAGEAMWRWIGGYYEDHFSCNPMWVPDYKTFPNHPVARGVKPFALHDEWYFNMRWAAESNSDASGAGVARGLPPGLTSILVDAPPPRCAMVLTSIRKGRTTTSSRPRDVARP